MQHHELAESLISQIRQKWVARTAQAFGKPGHSVIFNTESLFFYFTDEAYKNYVDSAAHVYIDGAILAIALRFIGIRVERYHGPDLCDDIFSPSNTRKILLLGGDPTSADHLIRSGLISRHIQLPFMDDPVEMGELALPELACAPETLCLISLGLPKQERVANYLKDRLANPQMSLMPVGAAIDFRSGVKTRSGMLWRKLGLEWLPRLMREPRMLKRNLRSLRGVMLFVRGHLCG